MDINGLDEKGLVRFLRREGVQFKEGEEEALIRERIEGKDALEMSVQDWRMIGLSFPTAKRVFAALSSPPPSQGDAAGMEKGKQADENKRKAEHEGDKGDPKKPKHDESSAAPPKLPSLRDFRGLQGKDLVGFAKEKELFLHDDCFSILEKNFMGADMIGSKSEILTTLMDAGFPKHSAQAVLKWLQKIFPVEVQVQVEDGNPYYLTLCPGSTVKDLFDEIRPNSQALSNLDFDRVRIKNGNELVNNPNTTLVPNSKYQFESGPQEKLPADLGAYLLGQKYSPRPKVTSSLVTNFGAKLPFLGRGETEKALLQWYKIYKENSVDELFSAGKSKIFLPIITGTPGIGKTRSLQEAERILQNQDPDGEFVTIYISFNSGWSFHEVERENPSLSIFLRVFWALYSIPGTFENLVQKSFNDISQNKFQWNLSGLLNKALETHQLPENTIFILALDEVQYSFKAGERIDQSSYFGQVTRYLATYFLSKNPPWLLPIFAGTATTGLQERILQGSSISSKQIPIMLLSIPEIHQIVEMMVEAGEFPGTDSKNVSWKQSLPFLQALAYAGSNPRSLEICLQAYVDDWKQYGEFFCFGEVNRKRFLRATRLFNYDKNVALHVLDMWFHRIEVYRTDRVGGTEFCFEDLEANGHFFLTKSEPSRVHLPFPNIFGILIQADEYLLPLRALLENSMPQDASDSKWFERVYLNYLATKINLSLRRPAESTNRLKLQRIFNQVNSENSNERKKTQYDVEIEFSQHVLVKEIDHLQALVNANFPSNSIYHFQKPNHAGFDGVLICTKGMQKVLFFLQIKRRSKTGVNKQKAGSAAASMNESLKTAENLLRDMNFDKQKSEIYFVGVTNGTCNLKEDAFRGNFFDHTNIITIAKEDFKEHVGLFYDLFVPEGQFEVFDE